MRRRFFNSGGAVEPPIEGPTFEAYDITDYVKQGVSSNIPQYVPIGTTIMYHKPSNTLKAFAFTSNMIDAMTDGQGGINSKTYAVNDYEPVGIVLYSRRQIETSDYLDRNRLCCISLHALDQEGNLVLRNGGAEHTFAKSLLTLSTFRDTRREVILGAGSSEALDASKIPSCDTAMDFNVANRDVRRDYMFSTDCEANIASLGTSDLYDLYKDKIKCFPLSQLAVTPRTVNIWSPFRTSFNDTAGNYYNPYIVQEENVIHPIHSGFTLPIEYWSVPYSWNEAITLFVDSLQERLGLYRVDTNFFTLPTINELRMMWARIDIITETEVALAEIFPYTPIRGSFKGSTVLYQCAYIYSCDYLSDYTKHLCMGYNGRLMALPLGSGVINQAKALVIPFFHLIYTDLG